MTAQTVKFSNNAQSTLAGNISAAATTCSLASGTGVKFPTLTGNDYFVASLFDAATQTVTEIVYVTGISGDVITSMLRGQEGTSAAAWVANDLFIHDLTAGQGANWLQVGQGQAQVFNYANDTGGVNALVVALIPAVTTRLVGSPIRVKALNTNTGAPTLNYGAGAIAIVNPDGSAVAAGVIRAGGIYQFVDDGTKVQLISSASTNLIPPPNTITAAMLSQTAVAAAVPMINGTIVTTPSANALTIALKTLSTGADPSVTDPVIVMFRNPAISGGTQLGNYLVRTVTSALSFTIAVGSQMGMAVNATPFNLYVCLFDNAGTVCIGAANMSGMLAAQWAFFPLDEETPAVTAASTSGGNSLYTFYANVASLTNVAFRAVARLQYETGLANFGQWATGPTKISLLGIGSKRPGDIIRKIGFTAPTPFSTTTTANVAFANTLWVNNTFPNISLQSAANGVSLRLTGTVSQSSAAGAATGGLQIGRGSGASPVIGPNVVWQAPGGGSIQVPLALEFVDFPASAGPLTYNIAIRCGLGGANPTGWLPSGGPGVLVVEEIQG